MTRPRPVQTEPLNIDTDFNEKKFQHHVPKHPKTLCGAKWDEVAEETFNKVAFAVKCENLSQCVQQTDEKIACLPVERVREQAMIAEEAYLRGTTKDGDSSFEAIVACARTVIPANTAFSLVGMIAEGASLPAHFKHIGRFLHLGGDKVFVPEKYGFEISTNLDLCNAIFTNLGVLVLLRRINVNEKICVHWPVSASDATLSVWKLVLARKAATFLFQTERRIRRRMRRMSQGTYMVCCEKYCE